MCIGSETERLQTETGFGMNHLSHRKRKDDHRPNLDLGLGHRMCLNVLIRRQHHHQEDKLEVRLLDQTLPLALLIIEQGHQGHLVGHQWKAYAILTTEKTFLPAIETQ